jgi:hypothetical protein
MSYWLSHRSITPNDNSAKGFWDLKTYGDQAHIHTNARFNRAKSEAIACSNYVNLTASYTEIN